MKHLDLFSPEIALLLAESESMTKWLKENDDHHGYGDWAYGLMSKDKKVRQSVLDRLAVCGIRAPDVLLSLGE